MGVFRDVDQAVAKAYRMSRHPSHLMTNAEYHNINMISSLRQPKAPLTPIQLGGPLAAHTFSELHRGHLRAVPLCEARNTKQAHNCAQRLKRRMIRSLGLLVAMIATQYNALEWDSILHYIENNATQRKCCNPMA